MYIYRSLLVPENLSVGRFFSVLKGIIVGMNTKRNKKRHLMGKCELCGKEQRNVYKHYFVHLRRLYRGKEPNRRVSIGFLSERYPHWFSTCRSLLCTADQCYTSAISESSGRLHVIQQHTSMTYDQCYPMLPINYMNKLRNGQRIV